MRVRARHAKPSRLRHFTLTTGLATAVTVPLLAQPAQAHSTSSDRVSASSSSLLQVGSRGSAVAQVQRRLNITADGVFGPRTRAAVIAFQRSHRLAADGVVGPQTRRALAGATTRGAATREAVTSRRVVAGSSVGAAAVREAARHRGKPYRWGATGPSSFDCSGYVQYVYRQVGVKLPRVSGAQAAFGRRVSKDAKRPGDLIAITTAGRVSHIAIYAGNNSMWVARRSGTTVTRQTIYTNNYFVVRVA